MKSKNKNLILRGSCYSVERVVIKVFRALESRQKKEIQFIQIQIACGIELILNKKKTITPLTERY